VVEPDIVAEPAAEPAGRCVVVAEPDAPAPVCGCADEPDGDAVIEPEPLPAAPPAALPLDDVWARPVATLRDRAAKAAVLKRP
jgi:hypothetical protein